MEAGIAEATSRQCVKIRRRDWPAEGRYLSEPYIVEQNDHDTRCAIWRRRKLWPFSDGVLIGLADLAAKLRFRHWKLSPVDRVGCSHASLGMDLLRLRNFQKRSWPQRRHRHQ